MTEKPTVAVINNNEDTIEMLRTCLEHHGFTSVATSHVPDLRKGRVEFASFLAQHNPRVIIYDVAIPYDRNWEYLQSVLTLDEMRGRSLVISTTNKAVLEQLVGPTDVFEIHGKPYDIEQIVEAVKRALQP